MNGSGTFKGSFTVLPYFEEGDTFTFWSGSGTTTHTDNQDFSKYNPD